MIRAEGQPPVDLLIVGASTRAAAYSALRSGFHPLCLDQFGDSDLRANAAVEQVSDYPQGLLPRLLALPRLPLAYVGGLENSPEILSQLAAQHELWGNDVGTVTHVRNPESLSEAARLARVSMPDWRLEADAPPTDAGWIIRPRFGAGGRGIFDWTSEHAQTATLSEPHQFQKRIAGESFSAVFIATREAGDIRFIGVTQQLIGMPECHARPYQWCGNIGPVTLSVGVENLVRRLGNILKWKLGLRGIFGIDFLVDDDGVPWVTEVNPRYPASVELLEFATGQALFQEHAACFTSVELPELDWEPVYTGEYLGKAVLYSPVDFALTTPLLPSVENSSSEWPELAADLPEPGQQFRKGDPVCTVYASGTSVQRVRDELSARLNDLAELCRQLS